MGGNIGFRSSQVHPVSIVHDDAVDLAAFDQLQQGGDDGNDFSGGDQWEDVCRADTIDAGKLVGAWMNAQGMSHVRDSSAGGIETYIARGACTAESERSGCTGQDVSPDKSVQGQVGDDVPVVNDQRGVFVQKVCDVFQAASRVEQDGFVTETERTVFPETVWKEFIPDMRKVMGIDDEVPDTELLEPAHRMNDQWILEDGNQRFGAYVGQGAEACSQTGSQNEGLDGGGFHTET